jgi:DNA-binding transcriptional LysR family regulator
LIAKPLASLSRHFYASKSFLKANGGPSSFDELVKFPFISLQASTSTSSLITIPMKKSETKFSPKSLIRTNSMGLTRSMAMAGAGIALLPDFMAQTPLVQLFGDVELVPAEAHFVVSQRQWLPAKTRAFIEHLQNWCAKNHV